MLAAIRNFIQDQKIVTERQLVLHFKIEASAIQPMLAILQQRHEIEVIQQDVCRQDCQDCENPIYYAWIESVSNRHKI